eukprot:TRINITY_DN24066_c0_g1_i2.p1 TRINITY_DN24066_c0_g1~~TRINITY_DN24066_c0_g1_i2.p1  ORF type:complete len:439 (+),score=122.33 TRINITY_DN24066_c0_g1_i2:35-1318(+)
MPDSGDVAPLSPSTSSGETESIEDAKTDDLFEVDDRVVARLLEMKVLLHTKLELPKDVDLPPYRLLGGFNMDTPELWGHALATLASEWCCAYLNTEGGILIIGVDSDGIIQGIPLNTHHVHLHAFLSPLFSTLDCFWPSISEGLVAVMLLPVFTPVAQFEPYYILIIRVRKGPFPCYLNHNGVGYKGDFVLKKLTDEDVTAKMAKVDSSRMAAYLLNYWRKEARKSAAMAHVIQGEGRLVFRYSAHWSHPPLTLIPETATTGPVGRSVQVTQGSAASAEQRDDRDKRKKTSYTPQQVPQQPVKKQRVEHHDKFDKYPSDLPKQKRFPLSGLSRTPQQVPMQSPDMQRLDHKDLGPKSDRESNTAPNTPKAKPAQAPLCPIIPHVPVAQVRQPQTPIPQGPPTTQPSHLNSPPTTKKAPKKAARKIKK